jgi:hypothetical protein
MVVSDGLEPFGENRRVVTKRKKEKKKTYVYICDNL